MQNLRYLHRYATLVVALIVLFLGVTGVLIQSVDLKSILLSRPADDPDVLAMRESFDGPNGFVVRQAADYTARPLPAAFDYGRATTTALQSARSIVGSTPLTYLEFRIASNVPIARVGVDHGHLGFDPTTGRVVERAAQDSHDSEQPDSLRNDFKHLHRMTTFGNWALALNIIASAGLVVLILTGTLIYFKLLKVRRKIKKPSPFWSAGGMWRTLHRSISIVAALFLAVVTLSGAWLATESVGLALYFLNHRPAPAAAPAALVDSDMSAAVRTTLTAYRRDGAADGIVALRIRNYGPYEQGVVVTGGGSSKQLVYNARDGSAMSLTEPGYPPVPFPFGWQAHQIAKSVHRGDYFGFSGRVVDFLAGLAMVYLSLSGIEMYWTMWRKRRNAGRKALLWK